VNGDEEVLLNILLHGLKGPIDGKTYPDVMAPQNQQTDEYIASVLSYIRTNLGNRQDAITPRDVKKARAATKDRQTAWTLEELEAWKKNKAGK
jgi:mono/diheme cytochrome c family protein